jgi:photosystem II stability/assembly factor-like uncharacterized protein
MAKPLFTVMGLLLGLAIASCSGSGGSGGKSSSVPLVLNLQATPSRTWVNAVVNFSVNCQSSTPGRTLTYTWRFGDGSSDVTPVPTDTHSYAASGSAQFTQYTYSVECSDGVNTPTTVSHEIVVWNTDLTTVAASSCGSGYQGFGWCWQNPLPTGSDLRAVVAISPNVGWAAGAAGAVVETLDGGGNWIPKYSGSANNIIAIQAQDQNIATIMADDGSVLRTEDAGATWSGPAAATSQPTCTPAKGLSLSAASIVSPLTASSTLTFPQTMWAINGTSIVETTNGGATWCNYPTTGLDSLSESQLNSIVAANATTAWIVGYITGGEFSTGFYAQTHDGSTWVPTYYSTAGTTFESGPLIGNFDLTSVSLGPAGSSACGSTDKTANTPASIWVSGLSVLPNDYGVSTGVFTLFSGNATGAAPVPVGSPVQIDGGAVVTAFGDNLAWASIPAFDFYGNVVGSSGVNIGSQANGQVTWTSSTAFPGTETINAFASADCRSGWAVGNGGSIDGTADGANTWNAQSSFAKGGIANEDLVSVAATTANAAYVMVSPNVVDINPADGIVSVNLGVFSTTDGGTTWNAQALPVTSYTSPDVLLVGVTQSQIAASSTGSVVIAAGVGLLDSYSSVLGGWDPTVDESQAITNVVNWVNPFPTSINSQLAESWVSVSVTSDSAWVIDSEGDVMEENLPLPPTQYSAWQLVSGPSASPPLASPVLISNSETTGIAALDRNHAVIVGTGGLISYTSDQGHSWQQVSCSNCGNFSAISIFGTSGWAVGEKIEKITTTNSGKTWLVTPQPPPNPNAGFSSVSTPDGIHVWAVGQSTVLYSAAGDGNWVQQRTGTSSLSAVASVDGNTAWVVGSKGAILKTLTGGAAPPSNYLAAGAPP